MRAAKTQGTEEKRRIKKCQASHVEQQSYLQLSKPKPQEQATGNKSSESSTSASASGKTQQNLLLTNLQLMNSPGYYLWYGNERYFQKGKRGF